MQARDLTDDLLLRGSHGAEQPNRLGIPPRSRVEYRGISDTGFPDALAVIRFGTATSQQLGGPLQIGVALEPLDGSNVAEVWLADGEVTAARAGAIRYAADKESLFGVIELDERLFNGLATAAETAYREILSFQVACGFPHLLRMWNYLDAINEQSGDLERYRQFCLGRARAFVDQNTVYPAASGIGRQHGNHMLQIFWLASRAPGRAVENPRQVSAYRYPPEHGPASPSFSRASIAADGTLFVSGTASIVGHASRHHSDPLAQLEETLRNLQALDALPATSGNRVLKVYIRDAAHLTVIRERLRSISGQILFLNGDICRRELLLEIECVTQPVQGSPASTL